MFEWITRLVPLLPGLAALLLAGLCAVGVRPGEKHTSRLLLGAMGTSLAGVLVLLLAALSGLTPLRAGFAPWISSGDYRVEFAFLVDRLSLTMGTLDLILCFLIARFSTQYMHRDPGFHRFFIGLGLFTTAMLLLTFSANYLVLFLGWELAGLCSYILIGYYFERRQVARAATRAILTNRVSDAFLLMGILTLFSQLKTLEFGEMATLLPGLSPQLTVFIGGCLLIGMLGKSGQLPFTPWLARSIEGPTPSSALFYGAVMIHAGLFLLLRSQSLLERSPQLLVAMAVMGGISALYSMLVTRVQTDAKGQAVHAVVGQVALMLLACAFQQWVFALVHAVLHALYRCHQFLSAPSILHEMHHHHAPVRATPERAQQPWRVRLYALSLQRFRLEELHSRLVVEPAFRLADSIERTERSLSESLVGRLPATGSQLGRALNRLESRLAQPAVMGGLATLFLLILLGGTR